MNVAAIMPCRGRANETLELIPRLLETAQYPFRLVCVVDGDTKLSRQLYLRKDILYLSNGVRQGYWQSLKKGIHAVDAELIVNLANDLLPGRGWLLRAVNAYRGVFGEEQGLVGFNDGIHVGEHAAHFLIHRGLLKQWYGDDYVPLCYDHMFGDTEISQRAIDEQKFVVAHFAVLFHNHYFTGRKEDAIYAEGKKQAENDEKTFKRRQAQHWH